MAETILDRRQALGSILDSTSIFSKKHPVAHPEQAANSGKSDVSKSSEHDHLQNPASLLDTAVCATYPDPVRCGPPRTLAPTLAPGLPNELVDSIFEYLGDDYRTMANVCLVNRNLSYRARFWRDNFIRYYTFRCKNARSDAWKTVFRLLKHEIRLYTTLDPFCIFWADGDHRLAMRARNWRWSMNMLPNHAAVIKTLLATKDGLNARRIQMRRNGSFGDAVDQASLGIPLPRTRLMSEEEYFAFRGRESPLAILKPNCFIPYALGDEFGFLSDSKQEPGHCDVDTEWERPQSWLPPLSEPSQENYGTSNKPEKTDLVGHK